MSSLDVHPALIIFATAIGVQLLGAIGQARIQAILLPVHLRLFYSSHLSRQKRLKAELFTLRQELAQTSSQDQFSKWAKLRRRVDKTASDIEAANSQLSSASSTLGLLTKAGLFALTTVFPFALTTWFGKVPMFYLPPAEGGRAGDTWLGPIGWVLALTAAPRGSVSAGIWNTICTRVLLLVIGIFKDLFGPLFAPSSSTEASQVKEKSAAAGKKGEAKIEEIVEEKAPASGAKTAATTGTGKEGNGNAARKRSAAAKSGGEEQ